MHREHLSLSPVSSIHLFVFLFPLAFLHCTGLHTTGHFFPAIALHCLFCGCLSFLPPLDFVEVLRKWVHLYQFLWFLLQRTVSLSPSPARSLQTFIQAAKILEVCPFSFQPVCWSCLQNAMVTVENTAVSFHGNEQSESWVWQSQWSSSLSFCPFLITLWVRMFLCQKLASPDKHNLFRSARHDCNTSNRTCQDNGR